MNHNVLLLYSRIDEPWKKRVSTHIEGLKGGGFLFEIDFWNDDRIDTADDWYPEFENSINAAGVIVLLVSKGLLESRLMQSEKIRKRLKAKQSGGFPIFILLLNKCGWRRFSWMKTLPMFPANKRLLSDLNDTDAEISLVELTERIAKSLKFEIQISEGILAYLHLTGVGPVKQLHFEPNRRLNIITGDNGFGKTLLLDCSWWALSGIWAKNVIHPLKDTDINDVKIKYQFMAKSGSQGKIETASYDSKKYWIKPVESLNSSGLVVYARYDGSFAVWDPVKAEIAPPPGASKPLSPLVFDRMEVFEGISEELPEKKTRPLCNGLFEDLVKWQGDPGSPFKVLEKIISRLSSCSQEKLEMGHPARLPTETRDYPTIHYSYGDVPIIHTASSVQRIVSLAYLLLWTWAEHKRACENRIASYKNMVIIIDEVENHLHPQWQRSIIPSLMKIGKYLDDEMDTQFLITTNSPMALASIEPLFEDENDKLFHLGIQGSDVILKEQPFQRHGRVDYWFMSDTFELPHARSLEAEKAIQTAKNLQKQDKPAKEEVENAHKSLLRLLGDSDPFWPRWTYFAEQYEVEV